VPNGRLFSGLVASLWTMKNLVASRRMESLILALGPLVTLAVSPFSSLDPINLIKMVILTAIAFALLALMSSSPKSTIDRLPRGVWFVSLFFLTWMTVVIATSSAPFTQQFWGVFGRNNGYLGYFSLVVILLAVAIIQKKRFYEKLVACLVLTSIPVTLYALVQLMGKDPISWSVMAPFATLGNINFSSAFFGLASLCATSLACAPKRHVGVRIGLLTLVLIDLWLILQTGSIQGFMIYIAGIGITGFFLLRSIGILRYFQLPYLLLGATGFLLTALALNNIGPLARFVFGDTILFRFDYWYAGWNMTIKNPLFGVGLDSYGDWYRELRGEIATLRTVPDRITNTAHNIYLDISASGGFPLLVAYLLLLGYAARAAFHVIRREQQFDPCFVALFSTWVAYLIQAAISINQIGVGIWGWLFTGALIGYEVATRDIATTSKQKNSQSDNSQLPAMAALLGIAGFSLGFLLSFIPFYSDQNFRDALQTGDVGQQFVKAKAAGATAYHMELSLDAAIKANNEDLSGEITDELIRRYPRDFMAWRVRQILKSSSPQERAEAFERLRSLDPFNPDIKPIN
jgi:O-antigen ligase